MQIFRPRFALKREPVSETADDSRSSTRDREECVSHGYPRLSRRRTPTYMYSHTYIRIKGNRDSFSRGCVTRMSVVRHETQSAKTDSETLFRGEQNAEKDNPDSINSLSPLLSR